MSLFSDKKIAGLRYTTCQSLKNPLGQVNLCVFFEVTALNLYVTIMKPEIKLIISAARLYQAGQTITQCFIKHHSKEITKR